MENWVDLLDPAESELARHLPADVHDRALERLLTPIRHEDEPRPRLESQGDYVFGVFLVPIVVHDDDVVFYQEVDVVLTREVIVTVRKTPEGGRAPYDPSSAQAACVHEENPALVLYHLVDDIAECFLNLVDAFDEEIDELEDEVEEWSAERVRDRLSALRHDILHIRRTLGPTRDAIRRILDNRVELEGEELFPRDIELNFADAYDKLLRSSDGLELSRDLLAGVRDYHQAKIANDQNDVMKRLTVLAGLVLVPTFIVGVYGQNFANMPELDWGWGYYGWSWGLIAFVTIVQLWYYRRKRWF